MNYHNRKILIVDDIKDLLHMVKDILSKDGYSQIVTASSVYEAMMVYNNEQPELAILDIMLPDGNGYDLFQMIRKKSQIPILFLTAKDEDADKILGLGLGADDYITKPFLPQELVLRVGAILRRTYGNDMQTDSDVISLGNRKILLNQALVVTNDENASDEPVQLTATELAILRKLSANRGNIVTFDTLCQFIWQDDYYGYENTLMVHIRHLRQKIESDPSHPQWLLTIRGVGYKLTKEQ